MERILFIAIILISVSTLSAKYVVFCRSLNWMDAQKNCGKNHTDLSLKRFLSKNPEWNDGWVSKYWKLTKPTWFLLSGDANATVVDDLSLSSGERRPKFGKNQTSSKMKCFFCFNLMVDDEVKKTWEEALEYCRETHTDLISLTSKSEQLLALSEIKHKTITKRVWIGLRYLGDRWLWVNGDPMVYENWRKGDQEHQCPLRKRCGALTKKGHWEGVNCGVKLNFICY